MLPPCAVASPASKASPNNVRIHYDGAAVGQDAPDFLGADFLPFSGWVRPAVTPSPLGPQHCGAEPDERFGDLVRVPPVFRFEPPERDQSIDRGERHFETHKA